jgi:hypothetical protein
MKRVNLDAAPAGVKKYLRAISTEQNGALQLELDGRVICTLFPGLRLSADQKEAIVERGRAVLEKARGRGKGVPAKVIDREVRQAVKEVRRRQQR